jgi:NAD(P)-dependent dehydrogenase (short-subunit alcohol dehydrogenase family)
VLEQRPQDSQLGDGPLAGRVVVITGASSGIGAHLVGALSALGASLVTTARRVELLEEVTRNLDPQRVLTVPGDLTDSDFPREVMRAAHARFGRLDVLLNNAGSTHSVPAERETTEEFLRILNLNLVALFACAREAYPYLTKSGSGSIVNMSSALGLVGIGRIPQASYCAAKGGVISLTRELAAQWASRGIRVNCIAPGWFPSEMTESMFDEKGLDYIRRTVPMQRAGRLQELDGMVAFLASDASSYTTGQTFVVDGGWTII